MDILCAYATFANPEEAQAISKSVVEKKLAACANIFAPHTAIYSWENKLNEHLETAVLFKTTSDRVEDLIREIIDGGSPSFLNWIVQQTNR